MKKNDYSVWIFTLPSGLEIHLRDVPQQDIDFLNNVEQLRARVVELEQSLSRIVSYYDLAKTGPSFPSMTDQAMAEHESTMFGEARKVLKNGR